MQKELQFMGKRFLDLARQGKNDWWRYLLAILVILFGWLVPSIFIGVVLVALVMLDKNPNTFINANTGQIAGVDSALIAGVSLLSAVALVGSLFVAVRFIHQRPFRSLITTRPSFEWKRVAQGFGFYLTLVAAASLIEALLFPGRYQLTWNTSEFLKFLPIVLILVPIQTTAEELLFRGYLMQSIGLITRRPLVPAVVSSFVFMLLHLANPEVRTDYVLIPGYYLGVGLLFALVTLRDNRLELAIGAHAGSVLFTALFANYVNSVLPTTSVFTVSKLDARYALISFVVMAIIFYAGLFSRRRTGSSTVG
jgi:membrane protease YdiL (CAAX protease family)